MPIYEFECGECGHRFEDLCAIGVESTTCPDCGAEDAQKRISTFAYSRRMTPNQRRRAEDERGTDRGGARERFQGSLDRARKAAPPLPKKKGPGS